MGYGKSLMLWHMLRRGIGDETFVDGLARFYRENRFRKASFADLEAAFSEASGEDLRPLFEQWVREHPDFDLAAPRTLNLICFRHRSGDAFNQQLLDRINHSGQLYLTHISRRYYGRERLRGHGRARHH